MKKKKKNVTSVVAWVTRVFSHQIKPQDLGQAEKGKKREV